MLEKADLGGREYGRIYDEAQKLIPAYSGSWTNWNQSDPGITILQSLALLSSKLDEAAEKTSLGDAARLLTLFGFPPAFSCPARLTLFLLLREREILRKGTPFLLRDTQFEVEEETAVPAGAIIGVRYSRGVEERDVSGLVRAKSHLTLFGDDEKGPVSIDIIFSNGAKKGEKLHVYFESDAKFPRNEAHGGNIPFAEVRWAVLSENGFTACEVRDGTSCFTRSGPVEITLADDMILLNGGYYVRAEIARHEYDVKPRISRIWGGHVELLQKRTLSRCVSFDSDSSEDLLFPMPFWDVKNSDVLVLGRDGNGDFRRYYPVNENKPRSYYLSEKNGIYSVRICCEKMPLTGGDSVRVLVRRPEALPALELGSVTGYDGQSFKPEWGLEYPIEGAKLMLRQKRGGKTVYEDVGEPDCNVFCEIAPDGEVTVRRAATDGDNTLFFSQLAMTLGESGNLSKKNLGEYSPGGFGGKGPGSIDESLASLTEELEFPHIAVTLSDYERLALKTPGLSIEAVSAGRNKNGVIQIAVKPYSDNPRPKLNALQKAEITRYLEERRILNSKIEVTSPNWVPVEIEINVSVYPQAVSSKKQISDAITGGIKWKEFGAELSYGKVHALLDALDCVEAVSRLRILAAGVEKDNINQDFASVFYLKNLQINYETRV